MTKFDDVASALDAVDTATTALGARIQFLIDDINRTATDGLNGPQTENVLARLAAFKTNLDALGSNPSAPIPPAGPTPPAMPGPFVP